MRGRAEPGFCASVGIRWDASALLEQELPQVGIKTGAQAPTPHAVASANDAPRLCACVPMCVFFVITAFFPTGRDTSPLALARARGLPRDPCKERGARLAPKKPKQAQAMSKRRNRLRLISSGEQTAMVAVGTVCLAAPDTLKRL